MSDGFFDREVHWSTVLLVLALAVLLLFAFFPHGGRSRIGSNNASAAGSLKAIATGQEQLKSEAVIDRDGDGVGEYGFLSELAVTRRGRLPDTVSDAYPYIPRILGNFEHGKVACKAGYCFRLYLPGGDAPLEDGNGVPDVNMELADRHEQTYLVFAWPQQTGRTGSRFYAMSARGEIFFIEPSPFSGSEDPPRWSHPMVQAWRGGRGEIRPVPVPEALWKKLD